ncbi:MAG: L-seryl-tRNA(Sec) selenium transferase [Defluviitaleaceae bacterium]|nr:L-seryl-tRNA(Sec) selenium transferase [Defluviitaleaceae bacterium]
MSDKHSLLRQIPKVDELLFHPEVSSYSPGALLTATVRQVLDNLRNDIEQGAIETMPSCDSIAREISLQFSQNFEPNLRRVINGTGIILHTNIGRAPLAKEALEAITETARDYSNLEYDISIGKRSSRHVHVEDLLTQLTGAEAAMVVNNNAAAVLLALAAVAHHKDVIVSRGELVEIGGSFRIPDVMSQSGCRLVEVGTTNKTHIADYEKALLNTKNHYSIDPVDNFTGALLRVHTSNFIISGFTTKPALTELAEIARKYSVPLIEDLGSGCMIPISGQPTVADSIKAGVDIVTFSGDKLLGGPQAGIIVGKQEYIAKMKSHPLARALRMDKLCIAALEATLRLYLNPETAVEKIPTLKMLSMESATLHKKAKKLVKVLGKDQAYVIEEASQAGGGAMPGENMATAAVAIKTKISAHALERHFRSGPVAIIGRISRDIFLLDVRTLAEEDFPLIAARLKEVDSI